tara:strand:+ start:470 stop:991 length:522 start_codon:yes stop_codon:yes gene_type:complete
MIGKKFFNFFNKDTYLVILVLILSISRLIPHPPNFTPIVAVAITSGFLFKKKYLSFAVLIISLLLSDFFIGFYKNMPAIYGTLLLITYFFFNIGNKINYKNLFVFSFLGALIFYLFTNLAVWISSGLYEKSLAGLLECYILAIPFFRNTLISTIFYSYLVLFCSTYINKLKAA